MSFLSRLLGALTAPFKSEPTPEAPPVPTLTSKSTVAEVLAAIDAGFKPPQIEDVVRESRELRSGPGRARTMPDLFSKYLTDTQQNNKGIRKAFDRGFERNHTSPNRRRAARDQFRIMSGISPKDWAEFMRNWRDIYEGR